MAADGLAALCSSELRVGAVDPANPCLSTSHRLSLTFHCLSLPPGAARPAAAAADGDRETTAGAGGTEACSAFYIRRPPAAAAAAEPAGADGALLQRPARDGDSESSEDSDAAPPRRRGPGGAAARPVLRLWHRDLSTVADCGLQVHCLSVALPPPCAAKDRRRCVWCCAALAGGAATLGLCPRLGESPLLALLPAEHAHTRTARTTKWLLSRATPLPRETLPFLALPLPSCQRLTPMPAVLWGGQPELLGARPKGALELGCGCGLLAVALQVREPRHL